MPLLAPQKFFAAVHGDLLPLFEDTYCWGQILKFKDNVVVRALLTSIMLDPDMIDT